MKVPQRQRCFTAIVVIFLMLLGVQAYSVFYYVREQALLKAFLQQVIKPGSSQTEQIKEIVLALKNKPDIGNDSYFLSPLFRPLRATPLQVIEDGGDCSSRSRLVVALLHLRGIPASQWALYNAEGEPVHAVIEAEIESGRMAVDPLFALWFPKAEGGYYGLSELKQDPGILSRRIHEIEAKGSEPGTARIESYPQNRYIYTYPRSINWNKSAAMKVSYRFFHLLLGDTVDELPRPTFLSEPPLMVFYGIVILEDMAFLAWLVATRLKKMQFSAVYTSRMKFLYRQGRENYSLRWNAISGRRGISLSRP